MSRYKRGYYARERQPEELLLIARRALRRLADVHSCTFYSLEQALGLSQGYLSRIASPVAEEKRHRPSPLLTVALHTLAERPELLAQIDRLWTEAA